MARKAVRFLYAGIRAKDLERSIRFYRVLGLRVRLRGRMDHGGEYVHLAQPGSAQRLELNFYPRGSRYYEPFRRGTELDHLGFIVDDAAKWARRLTKAGGKILLPLFEDSSQSLVYLEDPNGVCIELFSLRPKRRR